MTRIKIKQKKENRRRVEKDWRNGKIQRKKKREEKKLEKSKQRKKVFLL